MECASPRGEFPDPDRFSPLNLALNISNHVLHSWVKFRAESSDRWKVRLLLFPGQGRCGHRFRRMARRPGRE